MASEVRSFRGLKIWQRGMDLVPQVYVIAQLGCCTSGLA